MTETPNLFLPLLAPSQAQKHVTVNEALARVDGLARLVLASVTQATPPGAVTDGTAYGVPAGAVNAWAGQAGRVAVAINGGWAFVTPRRGWQAMIADQGMPAIWDGEGWRAGAVTLTPAGAGCALRSVEMEVDLTTGASVTTQAIFPARSIALGVTGRVTQEITGDATAWSLGDDGDATRYGSGLGLSVNSWVNGPTAPMVHWSPTALEITGTGGGFTGGRVRLVAHFAELALPDPI